MIIQAVNCYIPASAAVPTISYVGGKSMAGWGGAHGGEVITGLTGGIDTEPREGDYVLVYVINSRSTSSPSTPSITSPADFTFLAAANGADFVDVSTRLFGKFMPSTPDTSLTFGSATALGSAMVRVYRGVDPTTPMDVAVVPASGGGTNDANAGAITPATAGAVIAVFTCGAGGSGGEVAPTPGDLTEILKSAYNGSSSSSHMANSGHKLDWTSGAFDPALNNYPATSSNYSWGAVTVALRPA